MAALVLCEGFEKYGMVGVTSGIFLTGDWQFTGTGAFGLVSGLSANGIAMQIGNSAGILTGNFPAAQSRVVGSLRFRCDSPNLISGSVYIQLRNSTTANCSLMLPSSTGVIELRTGTTGGALINSGGLIALGTIHSISWDITLGAAGAYSVYLDGVLLFSGTGNTGNGLTTSNNIQILNISNATGTVDDIVVVNPADPNYNSSILTSCPVVETKFPTSDDTPLQFRIDGNVIWPDGGAYQGVYSTASQLVSQTTPGANFLFLERTIPVVNCTIGSISAVPSANSGAAKMRMVIYTDSGGVPGTLMSSGVEIIGATNTVVVTGALNTPQALTAGTPYWIGFITDSSFAMQVVESSLLIARKIANTYTSGPPSTAPAMTGGQSVIRFWGNCTGASTHYTSIGLVPQLGLPTSQLSEITIGEEDLFGFPALTTSGISTIYGVGVKALMAKSDAGSRAINLNLKSGSTDSTGSLTGQVVSQTPQWYRSFYDLDPNTGAAWSVSGVNGSKSGFSIAS